MAKKRTRHSATTKARVAAKKTQDDQLVNALYEQIGRLGGAGLAKKMASCLSAKERRALVGSTSNTRKRHSTALVA